MRNHSKVAVYFFGMFLIVFVSACGGGGGGSSSPPAPSAVTTGTNNVTNENAVLLGDVNPSGLETTAWFEYGTDNTLSAFNKTPDQTIGSGAHEVPVQATIQGLTAGAAYYFRVAASNQAGTSKGSITSFNAPLLPPAVNTLPVRSVNNDNAVLEGEVNPSGLPAEAWFEWGTDPTLNARNATEAQSLGSGTAYVSIQAVVAPLTPGTTYFFRAVARNTDSQNTVRTTKGSIESFKASQIPAAITNAATDVTSGDVILNGSVNPNGLLTKYWFIWGTDPVLTDPATTHETPMRQLQPGIFTFQGVNEPLIGLAGGTTYYFRIVASNAEGQTEGSVRSFATSISPVVTTQTPTGIGTTGTVFQGTANPNGYATNAWFEYGTDPSLTTWDNTASQVMGSGTSPLSYSRSVSLNSYTKYYYRAAASNEGGTRKGTIKSLFTGETYVAVGDSITAGSHDDILTDGIGFEPILADLRGVMIASEGVGGATSAYGAATISTTLSKYPSATYYLILYGTNDADNTAGPAVSKEAYKGNIQAIITEVKRAGKVPYLAKVPYSTDPSIDITSIQSYNVAIDELVTENAIPVVPPDFYAWFLSHPGQLADGLHPNGTGYQSMATLWSNALP